MNENKSKRLVLSTILIVAIVIMVGITCAIISGLYQGVISSMHLEGLVLLVIILANSEFGLGMMAGWIFYSSKK